MKHLLILLISILLLSSPVIGNNHKGETLYLWRISSGETKIKVWKGFGDIETHPKYQGEVENGVPNGLGFIYYPSGRKFVGSWKDGKMWNGTDYYKNGNIIGKIVNGKWKKRDPFDVLEGLDDLPDDWEGVEE